MGFALSGSSRPVCFLSAALMRRRKVGTADHSDCSTTCSPPRASVAGRGWGWVGRGQETRVEGGVR
jgi:hypothetical protein